METFSCPIQENQSSFGTIVHRPVCKQTIFTASTVCELEAVVYLVFGQALYDVMYCSLRVHCIIVVSHVCHYSHDEVINVCLVQVLSGTV